LTSILGNHGPGQLPLSIEYNASQLGKGGIVGEVISSPTSGAVVREGMPTIDVFRHKKAPDGAGAFQ
jgi:hypothetical protein